MIHAFMIFIGSHIQAELQRQGKTVTWFARQMGCSRTNAYKIFDKKAIDTDTLLRIARILQCDFFSIYSKEIGTVSE